MELLEDESQVSKSEETKVAYLNRAKSLMSRYQKSHNSFDYNCFVDWIISLKPKIGPSTWRQYKGSIVWFLKQRGEIELSEQLYGVGNEGCKVISREPISDRRTSARKKKSITEDEENRIISHLQNTAKDSYWSQPTLAFFKATIITGLRPEEWQSALLITNANDDTHSIELPLLKIKNAKTTNGRSHGEYRHLYLSELSDKDILFIKLALQYANPRTPKGWLSPEGKEKTWYDYYKRIRGHLYRTTKKLFPSASKKIAIYTCRHQFIANLKKAKFKREEIAAMVGHATDETATIHYGREKFGRSRGGLPKPNMDEVAKIRMIFQDRPTQTHSPGQGVK